MTSNYNYIYDEPINFKGLEIYPVTIKDYIPFIVSSACLTLDKNSIPDVNVISMSYLEYLYSILNSENNYAVMLDYIFRICLKKSMKKDEFEIIYGYDNKRKPFIKIGEIVLFPDDFDEIKKIICEQNINRITKSKRIQGS